VKDTPRWDSGKKINHGKKMVRVSETNNKENPLLLQNVRTAKTENHIRNW
jgi:hypothetical protein